MSDFTTEELAHFARLLGPARAVLDRCAVALEGTPTGTTAADMAQRIVDHIGHPVTDEAPAIDEWEYRDAGEHDWSSPANFRCRWCEVHALDAREACPSKRERRRVGPWEPVRDEGEAL